MKKARLGSTQAFLTCVSDSPNAPASITRLAYTCLMSRRQARHRDSHGIIALERPSVLQAVHPIHILRRMHTHADATVGAH